MSEITLRWLEKQMMVCSDSNGHSVVIGKLPEPEGGWRGVKPSELLLMSAASCATWDVVEILAKQKQPLRDLKVICGGQQLADPPYSFTSIHLHYIAYGLVDADRLAKAIQLAEDKYCSVISTLRKGIPVTSDWEIVA